MLGTTSATVTRDPPVRRLLVITYHFPPDGAVGGMRWAGFSKYLVRLGWEVHVITASDASADTSIPGVFPVVRKRRRTLNDLYNAYANRFKSSSSGDSGPATAQGKEQRTRPGPLKSAAMAVRRGGATWLMVPDYGRGWVFRAALAARKLLRKKRFDAVVSSGPPHSVHLAGVLATRSCPHAYWVDMRDPWAFIVRNKSLDPSKSAIMRFLIPRLEQFVFKRARRVITNTAEFAAALRAEEPDLSVAYVPNGIDLEQLPERTDERFEGCSVAYLGTMYAGRTLAQVFSAMKEILGEDPAVGGTLKLRIAGQMNSVHRQQLHTDLTNAGIAQLVEHHGVVPRAKALDLLNRSHLALVLAQDQQTQVPAKLYECIGLGVPTLVISELTSAASREARRIGAMTVAPDDVAGIKAVLLRTLRGELPDKVIPSSTISYEDLASDMEHLLLAGPERQDGSTTSDIVPQASPTPGAARAG